jgi:hypothetical protein
MTTDEVANHLQISSDSAYEIIHNLQCCIKMCLDICQQHMDHYGNKCDVFLDRIITGDET